MAEYGLVNYAENGDVLFDSRFPSMSRLLAGVTANGQSEPFLTDSVPPLAFCMPVQLNRFCAVPYLPFDFASEWQPGQIAPVEFEVFDRTATRIPTASVRYGVFTAKALPGADQYGLRTFAEDGELTFDSGVPFLQITGVALPSDWQYMRRYGPTIQSDGDWRSWSGQALSFYSYIYEVPLPPGTEFALIDNRMLYFENEQGMVYGYGGFDTSLSRFAILARVISSHPNNPPTADLTFPTVIFGRSSP